MSLREDNIRIYHYDGSAVHDLLLARWYDDLLRLGDWDKCFLVSRQSPSWFYQYFSREVRLNFVEDQGRIMVAGWFEPCLARGTFFSLWVAPEWRPVPKGLEAVGAILTYAFQSVDVVLSITTQAETLEVYQRMGYTLLGEIPHLGGEGRPVWLLTLTAAQLQEGTYGRWSLRKQREGRRRTLSPA